MTSSGTTSCAILQPKVNSGLPRAPSAAAGSSSRWETVHWELFQDTSHPESTCDLSDISHLETHTPTTRSRAVSVTSSLADSNLQAALAEPQRGITELKDIVVKKFGDKKPDDPRLGFCDFLMVEVVQLTSDSYDEFQQETFNLLMRLKLRDKQQQKYQHGMGMSMAQTVTYSQASTSHYYPVSHTLMQAQYQQMQQTFTHVMPGLSQQQPQHTHYSQQQLQHSQQQLQRDVSIPKAFLTTVLPA